MQLNRYLKSFKNLIELSCEVDAKKFLQWSNRVLFFYVCNFYAASFTRKAIQNVLLRQMQYQHNSNAPTSSTTSFQWNRQKWSMGSSSLHPPLQQPMVIIFHLLQLFWFPIVSSRSSNVVKQKHYCSSHFQGNGTNITSFLCNKPWHNI